ncbi:hypothetical protein LZ32DRAFT_215726 [Colletotrichum eremochloae]|uniref:Uncharacterized protein n=1 Tax=Colletotrichum sublineola TaxID=1173701 RepID=A0A066WWS6_COLSU|nr:hypothetical protein LY78DRAFT_659005 [Colletotrichum sublineola]KAK2014009.1 hypothetical protein LZ32DRAFT_215726 [Colletotrichum eremochloae]KDN59879.1 hypothetical protein CSUB01_06264 [Colletotrichum sublineola]
MRISIIARGKDTCNAGLTYFECEEGYRGCCHFNPCPGNTCPRESPGVQPGETIASVAAPVLISATSPVRKSIVTRTSIITAHRTQSMRIMTTTVFLAGSTGAGGAWYTDPKGRTVSSITYLGPSMYPTATPASNIPSTPVEPQVLVTSTSIASQPDAEKDGLSTAVQAVIAVSILVVLVGVITAWFLCTKQRRKLRGSRESISSIGRDGNSTDGSRNGSKEDQSQSPMTANPFRSDDGFSPFGGYYEEPQTRFNRASDTGSGRMMNHPISPDTRDCAILQPPLAGIMRPNTTSSDPISCTANETPDFICRTATATPDFICRTANATPDFISRLGTATPELHGPPQQAAIAELASPGLPRVVEICSTRSGAQMYKAYRPNNNILYPVAEITPRHLTGTLKHTEYDRLKDRHMNSWTKWDPIA